MTTYDVPREQWSTFFDQFSRLHHGQAVEVETTGSGVEKCANARGVPLLGITAEGDRLDIMGGDTGGVQLDHAITHPLRVQASEWNDGVSAALEIESLEGWKTRVQVGPQKEMLPPGFITDGILDDRS
jgi:hypothetical protein